MIKYRVVEAFPRFMLCGHDSLADLLLCDLLYVMTVNYVLTTLELQNIPGCMLFPG